MSEFRARPSALDAEPAPALAQEANRFPAAEARALRTPAEAERLAWRVLAGSFAAFLVLMVGAILGLVAWLQNATVAAPAMLAVGQGIVLFREREGAPLLQARDGMTIQSGDTLDVTDNALATLNLPGGGLLRLGPGVRLHVSELRAGRFNPAVGRVAFQHTAGSIRVEVAESTAHPPLVETPYGSAALAAGDYVIAVKGREALVYTRAGEARVSVGADTRALAAGERVELAANAPPVGPLPGAPNLVRNGDFAAGFDAWAPRDELERTPRFDRGGTRELVRETIDGVPTTALRLSRTSLLQTHNETGLMQEINADVAVYPEVRLRAAVQVRAASLSGGGYLGTEYPAMLRLHYRDAAGNGRTWVQGFYYQNPEERPVERGLRLARNTWTRFEIDLAQLPQRPLFVYALEVLGAGHDFDALIADVQLVAQ